MRSERIASTLAALALGVACSSNPPQTTSDASADVTYYQGGDGDVYAWNDAAGACQPASAAAFAPVKITPVVNPICTDAQIAGMVSQCFDPSLPDKTACTAWKAIPENANCLGSCPVASDIAASSWGPLVKITTPGTIEFWNFGGCVATMDPSPAAQACGDALDAQLECEAYACATNCPIPTTQTADAGAIISAEEAFINCTYAADSGPCASWVKAVTDCVAALPATSPARFCVDGTLLSGDPTSFDPAAEKLFGAQCGGAPPSDAGTSDGSTDAPSD